MADQNGARTRAPGLAKTWHGPPIPLPTLGIARISGARREIVHNGSFFVTAQVGASWLRPS